MSNSNFTQIGNTILTPSSFEPVLNQVSQGNSVLYANDTTGPVDIISNLAYINSAVGRGLVVLNNGGNGLTLGVDTPANASAIINHLGITSINQIVVLKFIFITNGVAASLSNTSGTQNYVKIYLNGAGASNTQLIKAGGLYVVGQSSEALVAVSAESLTPGAEVVKLNVFQQST